MCGVIVNILEDDDGAEPDLLLNLLNEGAAHFLKWNRDFAGNVD